MKEKPSTPPVITGTFEHLALTAIEPDPNNVRQQLDKGKLRELADSIRQHGVLQPILVRPHEAEKNSAIQYRIIAGERRYRASLLAGMPTIPATIWSREEAASLDLALIENMQREDVHPLDEALGFQRMKDGLQLDLKTLAQRLGKDPRYMARRLALTSLIAEAKRDFRQELISLAHALELCRLAPEIQAEALAVCYESYTAWDEEQAVHVSLPDKDRPVRNVRYVQEWIQRHVHLNLTAAPFRLDDERLREDGLTCLACPNRSGFNKTLFADIKDQDTCLQPSCYQGKLQSFVEAKKTALETKTGKSVMYCSTNYGNQYLSDNILSRDAYQPLAKRVDRCRFAEAAIAIDGSAIGKTQWICREATCQFHLGRGKVPATSQSPLQDRSQRKQEIFDLKVDEVVRQRVMQAALPTYEWPLERVDLNKATWEFFQRIPASDQKTIFTILGWEEDFNSDRSLLGQKLSELDNHALAQFLMLSSFAHYGANPARNKQVNQSNVMALSQEHGINHTLIDAQVRLELCPKKYKERHQHYLALVKQGESASKPTITERSPQTVEAPAALTKKAAA